MPGTARLRGGTVAGLLLLVGCSGPARDQPPLPADVVGTSWRAETLAGRHLDDDTSVTVAFPEAGLIAGKAACNRYTGALRVVGGRLRVGPLASTRMACPPPLTEVETAFLAALEGAQRFSRDNAALLLLSDADAEPSRFLPFTPP